MMDYKGKLVKKPWGAEYLLHETEDKLVGLWHLTIKPGCRTSLHCHPRKKCGLIVLKGTACVSFLSGNPRYLKAGEKIILRAGQFHSSKPAAGTGELELLEVETPSDKADLVRLEDDYGRVGAGMEADGCVEEFCHLPLTADKRRFGSCTLATYQFQPDELILVKGTAIFLSGGIRCPKANAWVLGPGDVVDAETLGILAGKFEPVPSQVLEVRLA